MSNVRQQLSIKKHREEFAQEQARKEAERLAPLRQAEQEFQRLAAEVAQKERELEVIDVFNAPSEELAKRCTEYKVPDPANPSTVEQLRVAIQNAFDGARLALASRGIELTTSGISKLDRVVRLNAKACDATSSATWETAYLWLEEIGALNRSDRIVRQQSAAPTPEPERKQSLDELLETTPGNEANLPKLRQAVTDAVTALGSGEFAKVFEQFVTHVYQHWGHVITDEQAVAIQRYFERHNLSFTHGPHYDQCRVALVKQGMLPDFLLTEEEVLSERLEHTKLTNNYHARVEFAQETRRLKEKRERDAESRRLVSAG